jgi:hypothetical protein
MKRIFQVLVLCLVISLLSSCASIVSKSVWPVKVDSSPTGATVTILNRSGEQVYKGTVPATMFLKSGAGFFKKESYVVRFELDGYPTREMPLEFKVNGWYWGNLLLGGVIGMVIVDPATGAMYKPSINFVQATMTRNSVGNFDGGPSLKICSIDEVPKGMEKQLVKIN